MNKSILLGAILAFLTFTTYACADTFTKLAGLDGVSVFAIIAISGWSGTLTMIAYAIFTKKMKSLLPKKGKLILFTSAILIVQSYFNILSFTNLPLTTVYIALFATPFFVSLLGFLFMGEKVNRKQATAIALGFVGVLVALIPEAINETPPAHGDPTIGFVALPFFVACVITMMLLVRKLGKTETPESITFISVLCRSVALTPFLFIEPISTAPLLSIGYVVIMGVFMIIGFLMMTMAYKYAPVAVVAPFQYTQLISGSLFGLAIWGTVPSIWILGGGILIVASGLITAHEAHHQSKLQIA